MVQKIKDGKARSMLVSVVMAVYNGALSSEAIDSHPGADIPGP